MDTVALAGGVLRGVGQVFLAASAVAGLLILVGMAVCSRFGAAAALLGSVVGLLAGLAVDAPQADLEVGLRGYNAVLCAVAVGGFLVVLTWRSALLAVVCAVGGSLALPALTTLLASAEVPPLTLPFVVVTFDIEPTAATIPEHHRDSAGTKR